MGREPALKNNGASSNDHSQRVNGRCKIGYGGPAPTKGKSHRYVFKLYTLGVAVDLAPGATRAQLEGAMKGHILAEGQLMRTYKR